MKARDSSALHILYEGPYIAMKSTAINDMRLPIEG